VAVVTRTTLMRCRPDPAGQPGAGQPTAAGQPDDALQAEVEYDAS